MQGSKRQRRPGVWEVRVFIGSDPRTGAPKQISKTVYGGARDADAALREMIDSLGPAEAEARSATFSQLIDRFLEECERVELSPTTLRNYRSEIEKTIRPGLGGVALHRLTARHLDELYGRMKLDGRSPKTIRNHHAVISAALHQAVRWGWLRENVAERAKPPRISQTRVKAPTVEAVRQVIEAAEDRYHRLAAFLMLAALTGMRRGEVCALRWSEVDLERGSLDVSRSVVVVDQGVALKSTKTDRSRMVALDDVGIAVLTRHRQLVEEHADLARTKIVDDPFVFSPELDGSLPFRPDTVTSFFIRVRDELGLAGLRLHDLRHFTATQLIGMGVDIRTVAGRLGHSDPSLTLRTYSHVLEQRDRAAAALMGQILRPLDPTTPQGAGTSSSDPDGRTKALRRGTTRKGLRADEAAGSSVDATTRRRSSSELGPTMSRRSSRTRSE